ncbi:MAG: hypothetical protein ACREJM_00365, partial [Candidatus Saccharimonadales bacterium]
MPIKFLVAAAWLVLVCGRLAVAAETVDWPSWRGPLAKGSVDEGSFPVEFGADRYRWRSPL